MGVRQQQQAFMDPEQQKHWDQWCLAYIKNELTACVYGIAGGAGQMHREL